MENKPGVAIVTFPFNHYAGYTVLIKFIHILKPSVGAILLVSGATIEKIDDNQIKKSVIDYKYPIKANRIVKLLKYVLAQCSMAKELYRNRDNYDTVFFILGGTHLFFPVLTVTFLRKNSIGILSQAPQNIFEKNIGYRLMSKLVAYSPSFVKLNGLDKFKHKIVIAPRHYIDFNKFKVTKAYDQRENVVGFIGRFSEEKGVFNLLIAANMVLKERPDLHFIFIGDGPLLQQMIKYTVENGISGKISFIGWISYDSIPEYLNTLKLVVIPSYSEGLPNILLEAMACGTPVLATKVGSIPDVISEGETGFLLDDNTPECIFQGIGKAINHPSIIRLTETANYYVKRCYTFESAVKHFEGLIMDEETL